MKTDSRKKFRVLTALMVMAGIGLAAGNAVAAQRTVVGEYFSADW